MTLKEAEQQLENAQFYFPSVKISFPKQKRPISQQVEFKRSDKYLTRTFLSQHKNLLSALISCHRSIQYATGRDSGIEMGKKMKQDEIINVLGLDEVQDDIKELNNRINNF